MIKKMNALVMQARQKEKKYFMLAEDEITNSNFRLLRMAGVLADVFLVIFLLVSPLFYRLEVSWEYLVFGALLLISSLMIFLMDEEKEKSPRRIRGMCYHFVASLLLGCIVVDIIPDPTLVSMFFPLVTMAMAVFFILPTMHLAWILGGMEIVYLVLDFIVKQKRLALIDAYVSIAAFTFALCIMMIEHHRLVREGLIRYEYIARSKLDTLTGLLNREALEEQMGEFLGKKSSRDGASALIILDLDKLKMVNRQLGYETGDRVLVRVGQLLQSFFDEKDCIGRLAGDQFIILCKDAIDEAHVQDRIEELERQISAISVEILQMEINSSIGVAVFRETDSFPALYDEALACLEDVKMNGGAIYMIKSC